MAQAPDYTRLLRVVHGNSRNPVALGLRAALSAVTPAYRLGVWWRNRGFDQGRGVNHVSIPVISVGNLTTGGTGKTPFVVYLTRLLNRQLASRGQSPAVTILSRGYGAKSGHPNDEALELQYWLPDTPHLQDADRTRMARWAQHELNSQAIVLDDGFQHRRLGRDLDIVLVDATNPFGFGRLLPRGLLREPIRNLQRAQIVVLTRSDSVTDEQREQIRQTVCDIHPDVVWAHAITRPTGFLTADGQISPIDQMRGKRVLAMCAIGNPHAFRQSLADVGCDIQCQMIFGDHHEFAVSDLQRIGRQALDHRCEYIVCTHKDLVKLASPEIRGIPVRALQIELELTEGRQAVEARICQTLQESSGYQPAHAASA